MQHGALQPAFLHVHPMFDFAAAAVLVAGAGLLVLLSHGRRYKSFRKIFGPSRLHLTLEGKVFLVLTGVICAASINTRINLMYLIAGLMTSALIVSVLFTKLIHKITVVRSAPATVSAGEDIIIKLELLNRRRLLSVYSVAVQDHATGPTEARLASTAALMLAPKENRRLSYRAHFPQRGVYHFSHVTLTSRFPFGLFEMQYEVELDQEIVVYPAIGHVRRLPAGYSPSMGQASVRMNTVGQEEFSHLRDFRPDDNPRRIHWRTSARKQKLHVMEFRGLPARMAEITFDTRIPEASPQALAEFEKATRVAATVADHLAQQGYMLSFSETADTRPISGFGKRVLPDILERLARTMPTVAERSALHNANGTPALKIEVAVRGTCSAHGRYLHAAASDPQINGWFIDREATT